MVNPQEITCHTKVEEARIQRALRASTANGLLILSGVFFNCSRYFRHALCDFLSYWALYVIKSTLSSVAICAIVSEYTRLSQSYKQMFFRIYYILLIMAIGLGLRLAHIDSRSLWLDEMTSMEVSSLSIQRIFSGRGFDSHTPPLYYAILHLWFALVPVTEFFLRLFSAIIDTANIALVYLIFRRQFTCRIGRNAALLYSNSAFAIYYAQEGRMYTLLVFLALLTYLLTLDLLQNRLTLSKSLWLAAIGVSGMYTHYYYAIFLFSLALGAAFSGRHSKKFLCKWFAILCLIALGFLPWIRVVANLAMSGGQSFRQFTFSVIPYAFFRFFAGYALMPLRLEDKTHIVGTIMSNLGLLLAFSLIFGFALVGAYRTIYREYKNHLALFLSASILPALIALALSLFAPMLSERYLIVIFPFLFGALALSPTLKAHSTLNSVLNISALGLIVLALVAHHESDDFGNTQWKDAAKTIAQATDSSKIAIVNPHYAKNLMRYYLPSGFEVMGVNADDLSNKEFSEAHPELANQAIWLIESGGKPSALAWWKAKNFSIAKQYFFPLENTIALYHLVPPQRQE